MQTFACQNHVRAVLRVGSELFVCATGVDAPIVYYLDVSGLHSTKLLVTCYLSRQFCPCCLFHPGPAYRGLCSEKMWGPYYMNTPNCLHPTRTVVMVDILSRTSAAMHTTVATAAVWQFEATQNRFLYSLIIILIFLACYHVAKNEKMCFCGAPFLWGLCSAEHAEHA